MIPLATWIFDTIALLTSYASRGCEMRPFFDGLDKVVENLPRRILSFLQCRQRFLRKRGLREVNGASEASLSRTCAINFCARGTMTLRDNPYCLSKVAVRWDSRVINSTGKVRLTCADR
jgi:hypothetical protein